MEGITALAILLLTIFPYKRLGSEFMPPLNEGTLLYMPTAVPGMSITEATKILQIQDRQLKKIPEAVTVFGKRARPKHRPIQHGCRCSKQLSH
jgi:copper/silver efflux system protein